ncbi:MAG: ParA family protein [Phycisphaerae bacterium]|nr:ParA family protein [Phycisphaerae bacterium]
MEIIAIVNEKGGSGKTTTAVNLSAALGEMKQKVLLVDLDGQAASSRWLGVEDDNRFADALWAGEGLEPITDVIPGVSLAPGSGKLDAVAHDLRPTQGGQLRKLLLNTTGFEYIIIDCPPSLGNRLIGNALLAATHAVVPVETSILALDGLKILLTTLQDIRDGFGHDIILKGVVACRFDARTKLSRFILTELKRALPGKVFNTVIRENVRVRECPASGKSILQFAPDSHAAEDYRSLAREILDGQNGDIIDTNATEEINEQELTQEEYDDVRRQTKEVLHSFGQKQDEQTPTPAKPASEIYNEKCNTVAEPQSPVTIETQQDHQANESSNIDQVRKQAEAMLGKFGPKPDTSEPPAPPEPITPAEPPAPFEPFGQDNRDAQFDQEPSSEKDHAYAGGISEEHQAAPAVAVIESALTEPKQETQPEKEEPANDDAADKQQEYPALRAMLQKMNETAEMDDSAT